MPVRGSIDFQAIAAAVLQSADRLVPMWLPDGRKSGAEWHARNPLRADDKLGSFSINLVSGLWSDFATGDKGGDLVSLYAYLFEGNDQGKAARKLAEDLRTNPTPTSEKASGAQKARTPWEPITPVPESAPAAPRAHPHRGLPSMYWCYRGRDESLLGYVYRFETSDGGKEVLPLVFARNPQTGRSEWRWMQWSVPRPLYGLDRLSLASDRPVLIVEGEKCADVAHAQLSSWFDVITWSGGGKAVQKADWSPLQGRSVIIWPDCDSQRYKDNHPDSPGQLMPAHEQPGVMAAEQIAGLLLELECTVRIVQIPEPGQVPNGWDIADAVDDGEDAEGLKARIGKQRKPVAMQPQAVEEPTEAARADKKGKKTGKPKKQWIDGLLMQRGEVSSCLANVVSILSNADQWQGVVAEDLFANRTFKRKPLPGYTDDELGEWSDIDTSRAVIWLTANYQITPATDVVDKAIDVIARANAWHPVRDWLNKLQWDGHKRIDVWLADYLQVDDTAYTRLVSRWFLVAMVARVFRPGVKFDTCLVLEGAQGLRKSSALQVLAGAWFSDTELDLANKDSMSAIRGKWLHEFGEMGSIARAESTRQKSFLSRAVDEFRPAFGRREIRCPRQLVFAGTTNDWQWQKDPTGGRRFWPVEVRGAVDTAGLLEVRPQLFAEALQAFRNGERWWPTPDEQRELFDPEQLRREAEDAFFDAIHDWLEELTIEEFSMHQVLGAALKLDPARMTRDVQTRAGQMLKKLGCGRKEKRNGVSRFVYTLPAWTKYQQGKRDEAVGNRDGAVPL